MSPPIRIRKDKAEVTRVYLTDADFIRLLRLDPERERLLNIARDDAGRIIIETVREVAQAAVTGRLVVEPLIGPENEEGPA